MQPDLFAPPAPATLTPIEALRRLPTTEPGGDGNERVINAGPVHAYARRWPANELDVASVYVALHDETRRLRLSWSAPSLELGVAVLVAMVEAADVVMVRVTP